MFASFLLSIFIIFVIFVIGDELEMTHFFDFFLFEFLNLPLALESRTRLVSSESYEESSVHGLFSFFFRARRLFRCVDARLAERRGRTRP